MAESFDKESGRARAPRSSGSNASDDLIRRECISEVLLEDPRNGSNPALITPQGVVVTRNELRRLVDRYVKELRGIVRRDQVVALRIPTTVEFVARYLALNSLGAIILPIDVGMIESVRSDVYRSAGAALEISEFGVSPLPLQRSSSAFDGACGAAIVVLTSGTTGRPRPIVHSAASTLWGVWNTASIADELLKGSIAYPVDVLADIRARSESSMSLRFYSAMPLSTIAGLTVMHRSLALGDAYAIGWPFASGRLIEAIRRDRLTNLALSPQMARALLRSIRAEGSVASIPNSLVSVGIGGGFATPGLVSDLSDAIGVDVTVAYGSTELGGPVAMSRPWDSLDVRGYSVGRPLAGVDVEIIPAGQLGRLHCFSRSQMVGTLDEGVFQVASSGLLDTGDLAAVNSRGLLQIFGRADFTILRGGRRFDPVQIERSLESVDGVFRAGVYGAVGRSDGEQDIIALIVRSGDFITEMSLRRAVASLLGLGSMPQRIEFVGELPTTADGEIQRHLLPALSQNG